MVAFVMFWAALAAMCFFAAGTLFKALASAFQALLNFAVRIVIFAIVFFVVVLGVSAVYEIIDGIAKGSVGTTIFNIVIVVVVGGILLGIVGGLGAVILELIIVIIDGITRAVSFALEGLAAFCEKGYAKSLAMIVKRLEKC